MPPHTSSAAAVRNPGGSHVHIDDAETFHRQVIAAVGLDAVAVVMVGARCAWAGCSGIACRRRFNNALGSSVGTTVSVDHDVVLVTGVNGSARALRRPFRG